MMPWRIGIVLVLTLVAATAQAGAQGYEWEWSPRSPKTMPMRFAGIELSSGYSFHQGSLPYVEDVVTCCTFTNGSGVPFRVAVFFENWFAPTTAWSVGGGVSFQTAGFITEALPLPDTSGRNVVTEYQLDASLTYLQVHGGIRQRLFGTFLSVGAEIRGAVTVASSYSLVDRVVSPDDFLFPTNPPSRERQLDENVIAGASTFVLEPALLLQYDVALGTGMVLSPVFGVAAPITSVAGDVSWRYLSVTAGVRLSRGL